MIRAEDVKPEQRLAEMAGEAEPRMLQEFQAFLIEHAKAAVADVAEGVAVNQFFRDLIDMEKSGALGRMMDLRRILKVIENPHLTLKLSAAQVQWGVEDKSKAWPHLILCLLLGPLIALMREWKRHGGQELLVDRNDLLAHMRMRPYYVQPTASARRLGKCTHNIRFSGKTAEAAVLIDLDWHPLGRREVSDEEFEASQMSNAEKGEFFARSEWVDPRRGDLFALVDILQGKEEEGEG